MMAEWGSALVFGMFLVAFTFGLSNLILVFMPNKDEHAMRAKVENGFFGAAGIIISLVFVYAMT